MTDSLHLGLPYIAAAQAQKHITHNEALRALDALVMLAVRDRDLTAPPGSPEDGARYLVKAAGTGAFAGKDGLVAHFRDGAWAFHAPRAGWIAYVEDEETIVVHDGMAWQPLPGGISSLQEVPLFGLATLADADNPMSAVLNNVLFAARLVADGGDGDLRCKLSKETAGNTASLLLQDDFSGRAEIGLAGDDDLHLKVSSDGATWREGLVIAAATGKVSFPQGAVGLREALTADRTYYVRSDGSDTNNGLANTSGGAFATLQKAWNTLVTLDLNGRTVTIKIGNTATLTAGLSAAVAPVGGNVIIEGDTSTPANTAIHVSGGDAISINCAANVTVQYLEVGGSSGIAARHPAAKVLVGTGVRFGTATLCHILANKGQVAGASTSVAYTISGDAQMHYLATNGGSIVFNNPQYTFSGTRAFSAAFAYGASAGVVDVYNLNIVSGSATGPRYFAELNGVVNAYGAAWPGNAAGGTSTGGQSA